MELLKDKEKIGEYGAYSIYLNYKSLLGARGLRKQISFTEKLLGRVLLIIGSISFGAWIYLYLMAGKFNWATLILPQNFPDFFITISLFLFTLGSFLLRNKSVFDRDIGLVNIDEINSLSKKGRLFLDKNLSEKILNSIDYFYYIDYSHFFQNFFLFIFKQKKIDKLINQRLGLSFSQISLAVKNFSTKKNPEFKKIFPELMLLAFDLAVKNRLKIIDEVVLATTILKYYIKSFLLEFDVTDLEIESLKQWVFDSIKLREFKKRWKVISKLKPVGAINSAFTSKATPILDKYSTDLTKQVALGEFGTALGREGAILNILKYLESYQSTSVLLLGDPGVGKTRVFLELATRMVIEDVPKSILDSRLISIDISELSAKLENKEEIEQVIIKMMEEVLGSGNIVLVIDHLAQIWDISGGAAGELVDLLASFVKKSKIKLIASSNYSDYIKFIKPQPLLAALFTVVDLPEPQPFLAMQILLDESVLLEKKFQVKVETSAIKRIIEFANKFDTHKKMPAKGLELLNEVILEVKNKGENHINSRSVEELLGKKLGVSVGFISQTEAEKLLHLESVLGQRVIGQLEAISSVCNAIRRTRTRVSYSKKPVASFLFYGPTGVGKTEVAKALAQVYYGSDQKIIRLDMSEYNEEENLYRLIGKTDKDGNFEGGYLTESVRAAPFSLILLDELEKCNKKVLDLFLQVLDEGSLTDGIGRKIDFSSCIIIATSNAGTQAITELIEKTDNYKEVEIASRSELEKVYRIEFLNRFDKVIMFRPLTKSEVKLIIEKFLNILAKRLLEQSIVLKWDDKTIESLLLKGYSYKYGAREILRTITEEVEDKIANLIIEKKAKPGSIITFAGLTPEVSISS